MLLPELREEICTLHDQLPMNSLMAWTSGNISARDPETNLLVNHGVFAVGPSAEKAVKAAVMAEGNAAHGLV
ncbi:MAG: hypothetical protein JSV68_14410, partial [Anaerolineaceae bacterium]